MKDFIPYINIVGMIITAALGVFIYIKSVSPAKLEKKIGEKAYKRCAFYRKFCSHFLGAPLIGYVLYLWYPLPLSLPVSFENRLLTLGISIGLLVLGIYFFKNGRRTLGAESMTPDKNHDVIARGMYDKIRHPQAVGEILFWHSFAFFLNSPFICLITLLWIPLYALMSRAEEKDLLLRYGDSYRDYMKRTGFFLSRSLFKKSKNPDI